MSVPSISVVIPLYNKALYVERALRSVEAQTVGPIETIVVDDGSTDGGADLVARRFPGVTLLKQPNAGQSAARNAGIAAASGTHIAFLDADDEWRPGFTEAILRLIERFPAAAAYAAGYVTVHGPGRYRLVTIAESQPTLLHDYFRRAREASIVWVSAAAARRADILQIGAFRVGEHRGGDRDLWARLALRGAIAYHPEPLAIYRTDASGRENPKAGRKLQRPPFALHVDTEVPSVDADTRGYANHLWWQYAWSCVAARNRDELRYVCDRLRRSETHRRLGTWLGLAAALPWPILLLLKRARTSAMGRPRGRNLAGNGVLVSLHREPPLGMSLR